MTRPSFDSIQALLLLSFVLLNDMKAEASWALTGLTCRLGQSLACTARRLMMAVKLVRRKSAPRSYFAAPSGGSASGMIH